MSAKLSMFISAAILGACITAGAVRPAHASDRIPTLACSFAKMHAALTTSTALNKCFRTAIASHADPDPTCVDAASTKLHAAFAKIEAKDDCADINDESSIERLVDRFATQLATALSGVCTPSGSECQQLTPCCSGFCTITEIGQTGVCS